MKKLGSKVLAEHYLFHQPKKSLQQGIFHQPNTYHQLEFNILIIEILKLQVKNQIIIIILILIKVQILIKEIFKLLLLKQRSKLIISNQ